MFSVSEHLTRIQAWSYSVFFEVAINPQISSHLDVRKKRTEAETVSESVWFHKLNDHIWSLRRRWRLIFMFKTLSTVNLFALSVFWNLKMPFLVGLKSQARDKLKKNKGNKQWRKRQRVRIKSSFELIVSRLVSSQQDPKWIWNYFVYFIFLSFRTRFVPHSPPGHKLTAGLFRRRGLKNIVPQVLELITSVGSSCGSLVLMYISILILISFS